MSNKLVLNHLSVLRKLLKTQLAQFDSMAEYLEEILSAARTLEAMDKPLDNEILAVLMLSGLPENYEKFVLGIERSYTEISTDIVEELLLSHRGNSNLEIMKTPLKKNQKTLATLIRDIKEENEVEISDVKTVYCLKISDETLSPSSSVEPSGNDFDGTDQYLLTTEHEEQKGKLKDATNRNTRNSVATTLSSKLVVEPKLAGHSSEAGKESNLVSTTKSSKYVIKPKSVGLLSKVSDGKDSSYVSTPETAKSRTKKDERRIENETYCNECKKSFDSKTEFSDHIFGNLCLETGRKISKVLSKKHKISEKIDSNVKSLPNSDSADFVSCEQCRKCFRTEKCFNKHLPCRKKYKYKCSICGIVCRDKTRLKNHENLHKKERENTCNLCPAAFPTRFKLVCHVFISHNDKVPNCNQCGNSPVTEDCLRYHLVGAEGERLFNCNTCGHSFKSFKHLYGHNKDVHTLGTFTCDICKKVNKSKQNLKGHMMMHLDDASKSKYAKFQKVLCPICGIVTQKFSIQNHLTTHSREKPYECKECPSRFKYKYILKKHIMTIHDKVKPFKCDFCDKCFDTKSHAVRHLISHTQNKPFVCKICNCGFQSRQSLNFHVLDHTGRLPFECTQCGRGFKANFLMQAHIKKTHRTS